MVQGGSTLKRVAFCMQANPNNWLGGLSYFRNLFTAICANDGRRIEPVLLAYPELHQNNLIGFPDIEVIRSPLVAPRHPLRLAGRLFFDVVNRDLSLEALLRKHRLDAMSHSTVTGRSSKTASISWIPDFQHIRMPQYFNQSEIQERNKQFRRLANESHRIIVSSNDALRDFAAFAPDAVDKARVLQFVSCPGVGSQILPLDQLNKFYGVDRPYFHLPNQFWTHKNHAVVIEALSILKKRDINVLVLATGNTLDHRDPLHFGRLTERAKQLGVDDRFRTLGIVPLPVLHSLMRNAIALINPSNFEGWSTTVEESKSLGLPIVLSDIPVHIEQAPPFGRYFKAGSAEDLAEALEKSLQEIDPLMKKRALQMAAVELPGRIKQFGRAYDEIAMAAIADAQPS